MAADTANMSKLKRTRRIMLIGFGCIALAFVALGVMPHVMTTRSLQARINTLTSDIENSKAQSQELGDLTRRVQVIKAEVRNYDRLVPAHQDLGTFLGELSRELDNAGLKDIMVRALPPTVLGRTQQLPIEIKANGSFEQVQGFMTRLENLPRMSSVSRLVIESDQGMSGKVSVELMISIYNTKQ